MLMLLCLCTQETGQQGNRLLSLLRVKTGGARAWRLLFHATLFHPFGHLAALWGGEAGKGAPQ
jgi:hypothetical protein